MGGEDCRSADFAPVSDSTLFRDFTTMPRAVVFDLPNHMQSSLAIAIDVLGTANAIQRRTGRAEPFAMHRLKVTRATRFRFRAGDVVIVPGVYAENASELMRRLRSPPMQRAM